MMTGQDDEGPLLFPSIIQDKSGKLKMLPPKEAYDYAIKSGEHIRFKTPEEADWFAKNYKKIWETKRK
jgi:hypothetical protein